MNKTIKVVTLYYHSLEIRSTRKSMQLVFRNAQKWITSCNWTFTPKQPGLQSWFGILLHCQINLSFYQGEEVLLFKPKTYGKWILLMCDTTIGWWYTGKHAFMPYLQCDSFVFVFCDWLDYTAINHGMLKMHLTLEICLPYQIEKSWVLLKSWLLLRWKM